MFLNLNIILCIFTTLPRILLSLPIRRVQFCTAQLNSRTAKPSINFLYLIFHTFFIVTFAVSILLYGWLNLHYFEALFPINKCSNFFHPHLSITSWCCAFLLLFGRTLSSTFLHSSIIFFCQGEKFFIIPLCSRF